MQINIKVDFNTLGIKVSFKVILLLMYMVKHSQSTQSNKFAISSQYPKNEVKDEVHFLHADKHQSLYKLPLSFLMEVARRVQSTRNWKMVILLQHNKKKVLLCSLVVQNIHIFFDGPVMFFVTCFFLIFLLAVF